METTKYQYTGMYQDLCSVIWIVRRKYNLHLVNKIAISPQKCCKRIKNLVELFIYIYISVGLYNAHMSKIAIRYIIYFALLYPSSVQHTWRYLLHPESISIDSTSMPKAWDIDDLIPWPLSRGNIFVIDTDPCSSIWDIAVISMRETVVIFYIHASDELG